MSAVHYVLSAHFSEALAHARAFIRCECDALEFERRLLDLGFYNVEFHPPKAAYAGVTYPLMEMDNVPLS